MFLNDAKELRSAIETLLYAGKSDSMHILDVSIYENSNCGSDDPMRFMVVINDSFAY